VAIPAKKVRQTFATNAPLLAKGQLTGLAELCRGGVACTSCGLAIQPDSIESSACERNHDGGDFGANSANSAGTREKDTA
jgi:hypothetical protein